MHVQPVQVDRPPPPLKRGTDELPRAVDMPTDDVPEIARLAALEHLQAITRQVVPVFLEPVLRGVDNLAGVVNDYEVWAPPPCIFEACVRSKLLRKFVDKSLGGGLGKDALIVKGRKQAIGLKEHVEKIPIVQKIDRAPVHALGSVFKKFEAKNMLIEVTL